MKLHRDPAIVLALVLVLALAVTTALGGPGATGPRTLEDIYGDTGESFQGGIGFLSVEGTDLPDRSFGLAIDDVVLRWREFSLAPDATDCAVSGSCATIDVDSVFQFTPNEVIEISLLDECPYGPAGVNNCDGDSVCSGTSTPCDLDGDCAQGSCSISGGACNASYDCPDPYAEACNGGSACVPDYDDPGDDTDCDDDGTPDVVVRAVIDTASDPDGAELVVLNRSADAPALYRGELPVSSTANSKGVLFVSPIGTDNPTVTIEYRDEDDCTGQVCRNSVDPRGWGIVDVDTLVLLQSCSMSLVRLEHAADNGDGDQFADANETVDVRLVVANTCGIDLTGCTAMLTTGSPTVDCLLDPVIELGDLAAASAVSSSDTGTFRVADVTRTSVDQILQASFGVAISCDQFDATSLPLTATVDLDLDLPTAQTPITFVEGFESGLGAFQINDIDAGIPPDLANGETDSDAVARADGLRCQYSDPDWPNSNSFNETAALDCYPGPTLARANMAHWRVDGASSPGSPDGGRAHQGASSLYWGEYLDPARGFTIPFASIEAIELTQPVNIGAVGAEVSWYHQVDVIDSRSVSAPAGESADRGVAQIQVVDQNDVPVTSWNRVEPYFNGYDQQGTDNYTNCMFDPVDDGTTEDDFFDPTDPDRRLGPSSTCFPQFSFVYHGDTDQAFSPLNLGNATNGPGVDGSLGIGTWVEVRADLSQYVGQRVKFRFLMTGLKVGTSETVEQIFGGPGQDEWNPTAGDDGWWIDSFSVTNTFENPVSREIDSNDNAALPSCGPTCTSVTASVALSPPGGTTAAPGQVVEFDAAASFADRCVDGLLQFRFSTSAGVLRGWSDDPVLLAAPIVDTSYTVEVRCSSEPTCRASETIPIRVVCPGGSTRTIVATDPDTFAWDGAPLVVDRAVGSFSSSSEIAGYAATITDAIGPATSVDLSQTPAAGSGLWLLVKRDGPIGDVAFCNGRTWRGGGVGEADEPARDAALGD